MEAWQQRVIDEKNELDEKIIQLNHFLNNSQIDHLQRVLLDQQLTAMLQYFNVLRIRVALFEVEYDRS